MKRIKYYIVDVFTSERFGGNQLAVIPDATDLEEEHLQKIAKEFNFSETTFVFPPENKENDVKVRIFTPGREIPTAGHPTIGTAYVLLNHEKIITINQNLLIMEQRVGNIEVFFENDNGICHGITMKQPHPVFDKVFNKKEIIAEILGINSSDISNDLPIQAVSCGNNFLFIPLKNMDIMKFISVNPILLNQYKDQLPSTELYTFTFDTIYESSTTHGRMFAPLYGITEDPVTGSASGPLGCYLVKHGMSDGKQIICEQGFEMGRPGMVYVDIETSDSKITGIHVGGHAIIFGKGELHPEPTETKSFVSTILNKI